MRSEGSSSVFSVPLAILIGSLIISFSILLVGNAIPLKPDFGNKSEVLGSKSSEQNQIGGQALQPTPQSAKVTPLTSRDHLRGDKNARILLIEYSDLECPFCKRFHTEVQKAVDSFPKEAAWVYRHFPLDQLHSKADKEAEATECAAQLGGEESFWKMVDKIFEATPSNNGLNLDDLPKLASEIGLNETNFKSCLDSGRYAKRVEEDYQSGVSSGVQGTPANFLLDTKTGKQIALPGAVPLETLKQSISSLLES